MTRSRVPVRRAAVARAHPCPCCGRLTSDGHSVCGPCWVRIPEFQRRVLAEAFRNREADPVTFAAAVALTVELAVENARRSA